MPRYGFDDLCERDKGNNSTLIALAKSDNSILDTVIHGDCLEVLQGIESNSLDCCVVDPPYGLGEVKDIAGLLNAWLKDEDDSPFIGKSGFMGKEWDAGVPSPRYWREVYRVLKPGAHILCFAGTRTLDLMALSLRLSGFQYRETLMWLYGSGFPKSTAIDKQIDKRMGEERKVIGIAKGVGMSSLGVMHDDEWKPQGANLPITKPATPESEQWSGWGSALKPAWEPILLFRKPLEGTLANNTLRWGVGGLHIDATRVGTTDYTGRPSGQSVNAYEWSNKPNPMYGQTTGGNLPRRFPSNLLLSHSIFCVPRGVKKVRGTQKMGNAGTARHQVHTYGEWNDIRTLVDYSDEDGMEEVEAYECDTSCPILQIDLQSGVRKSGLKTAQHADNHNGMFSLPSGNACYSEQIGGASRYFQRFPVDEPDFIPFKYAAKASRRERNEGCDALPYAPSGAYGEFAGDGRGRQTEHRPEKNNHPTVKPQQLVSWLEKLICPLGGIILDPFGGSGTTGVSAVKNGFHYILIEQSEEYCYIAEARIEYAKQHAPQPVHQEEYDCAEDCPIRIIGEQSGVSTSPLGVVTGQKRSSGIMGKPAGTKYSMSGHGDTGTAARFFQQFPPDSLFGGLEVEA